MTLILSENLPEVKRTILNKGDEIHIPKKERDFLNRRDRGKRHYKRYPSGSSDELKTAYMKHVSEHAISLIKERFSGTENSILLVGHNSAGVSLLKLLLQKAPGGAARVGIDNIGIWMVEEQKDGSFKLQIYNDKPFLNE
jgi:broad specificity phosphatase PhoE